MRRWFVFLWLALAAAALPQSALAWWQQDWSYRKPMAVDTTPNGAGIAEPLGRMPVLVRLHAGNFQFDGVQDKGGDLRFVAADDKTPLNAQVEQFDPLLGMALVWVDMPAVAGSARQDFWMYYGNAKAAPAAGTSPFDADYTAVLHFDGSSGAAPADATAYHNNAQAGVALGEGLLGQAAKLDGKSGIQLPASESLKVAAGGAMTFGAWVRTAAGASGALYLRRDGGGALVVGLADGVPYVRVGQQQALAPQPLGADQWTHVAVAAGAGEVALLVNGQEVAKLAASLPALAGAAAIGVDPAGEVPALVGDLDEVRLSRVRRPSVLLAAEAAMQGRDSKLLAYGPDEKQAGGGFGEIGFILANVPADAWVVIGLLAIMAVLSWWVTYTKATYVSRVSRANDAFMAQFRKIGHRLEALSDSVPADAQLSRSLQASSLYRLYQVAVNELRTRRAQEGSAQVTAETIEAIRASMDATRVRENQRLNRGLVLLTISISGGPYLGLLGTVVGIILVFAAVALAGEVNINAIAPGIAAALVATVVGLFVAIPALFSYNYLLTRNKNVSADMEVFVDEFVTRLAELHAMPEAAAGTAGAVAGDTLDRLVAELMHRFREAGLAPGGHGAPGLAPAAPADGRGAL
ncbi:biopolymer transporter ExbB (plasmid) [Cupriavidus sp. USMAA2-4]|uniref:MotA/TolQ/ExbB proton channel family protein n=1 Tax=Cupriavidus sp. USMAA2-4 TaxID=876364 RepID=UPI0008A69EEF|nr:MotA/TolQ/ExbB proton channel family protein [Cupriavidus sp. USMAA2-4]AOY97535.1 biopolymer transporter ExbB [Cupriavidus sp. USMAA2-4]